MRLFCLTLLAILISCNVNAANLLTAGNDLNNAINKSIEKQSTNKNKSTIVYGGKDISRSIVATNEYNWIKQPLLIG